jgi:hypothetical protein
MTQARLGDLVREKEDILRQSPAATLAGLCFAAGLFNIVVIPASRAVGESAVGLWWMSMSVGIVAGQVGAMALWLVWGEGTFLQRLGIHWGVFGLLLLCFLVGTAIALADVNNPRDFWRDSAPGLCLLPLVSLAAQLPVWPLRTHFGWRVEYQYADGSVPSARKSLSIGDILLGTFVTALTLTLVRIAAAQGPLLWTIALTTSASVLVVSLLVAIPALLLTLRMKELVAGILFLVLYGLVAGFIWIAIMAGTWGRGPPAEVALAMFIALFAFAAATISPLVVLRLHGYRLVWPRDRFCAAPPQHAANERQAASL